MGNAATHQRSNSTNYATIIDGGIPVDMDEVRQLPKYFQGKNTPLRRRISELAKIILSNSFSHAQLQPPATEFQR